MGGRDGKPKRDSMPNLIRRKEQSVSCCCPEDKRAVDFDLKRCQELKMIFLLFLSVFFSVFEKGFLASRLTFGGTVKNALGANINQMLS